MSFQDLNYKTIIEVMRQNNDKASRDMKKGVLNQIHQYDADKVLNFVIEVPRYEINLIHRLIKAFIS